MKFADEFRDPTGARGSVRSITELAGDVGGRHRETAALVGRQPVVAGG